MDPLKRGTAGGTTFETAPCQVWRCWRGAC